MQALSAQHANRSAILMVCIHTYIVDPHRVTIPDCCFYSNSLGLLLGTETPVMMPSGVDFSFLFFLLLYISTCFGTLILVSELNHCEARGAITNPNNTIEDLIE